MQEEKVRKILKKRQKKGVGKSVPISQEMSELALWILCELSKNYPDAFVVNIKQSEEFFIGSLELMLSHYSLVTDRHTILYAHIDYDLNTIIYTTRNNGYSKYDNREAALEKILKLMR